MLTRTILIIVSVLFLSSCVPQKENRFNSNLQANKSSESSSTLSENDVALPKPITQETQVDVSQALGEVAKRIDERFQKCSNGLTYTMSGSSIYEIEGFDYDVVPEKERPTYIELKNKTTWVGQVILHSLATREYEIVSGCWSKYNSEFEKTIFPFSDDNDEWNLQGIERYKKPTCKDVEPYVVKKTICPQ